MKMQQLKRYLTHSRDSLLLLSALILLIIALFRPSIPLERDIHNYIFVTDITQSMNVLDMGTPGKAISRLEHTKAMMRGLVSSLPCGTKVSIGLFAGVSVAAMYVPIEVCHSFAAIQDTIDHLDWRFIWSGNSRIRSSVVTLARVLRSFPEPAQVVFFTDGEEAPILHVFNRYDLSDFQGGDDWLFVGVGSDKGTPIPKLNEHNQLIGYWASESLAMQPGIAQISESIFGARDNNVASSTGGRYLSRLDEDYLKSLTQEINAKYVRGDKLQNIRAAMAQQKPAKRDLAPYAIDWVLAGLAGLLVLLAYLPRAPLSAVRKLRHRWRHRSPPSSDKPVEP